MDNAESKCKPLSQTHRLPGQRRVNMQISESDSAVTWTTQRQYAKPLSQTHQWHGQCRVNMQNLWVWLSGDLDNSESICKSLSQTQRWHGQSKVKMQNLWVRLIGDHDNAVSICKISESDSEVTWTTQSQYAKPLSQTQRWPGQLRVNLQNLWVRLSGDTDNAQSICKTSESDSAVAWTTQSQYAKPLSQTQQWHGQRRVNMQNQWVRLEHWIKSQ